MAWTRPKTCDQCEHDIASHTIWEPDSVEAGWMHCTAPGCTRCWHQWPATNEDDRSSRNKDTEALERERRQLQLMIRVISDFRQGTIPISRAINDLEALGSELQLAPPTWHDDFVESWSGLEIAYAVALDRLTPIPDATDPAIADDLHDLQRLVATQLGTLGEGPEGGP